MSIRTYFENIADAIREKTESEGNYTPDEMPQAILDIETGDVPEINFFSYEKMLSKFISNDVNSAVSGNVFKVANKNLSSICLYSRKNISITLRLLDMTTQTILKEAVFPVVVGWNYLKFPYTLQSNYNYCIYAVGESATFRYSSSTSDLTPIISDGITFVEGRWGSTEPNSANSNWMFSVLPQFLEGQT